MEIEQIEKGNLKGIIYQDSDCESPRIWDNLGKIVAFHGKYELGDKTKLQLEEFNSWQELHEHLISQKNAITILPIFLYDHSGLRIKVGSFQGLLPQGHAEFDSEQIGFIYADKESVQKELGIKKITNKVIQKVTRILEAEIDTYDRFLSGNIFGFRIIKTKPPCKCCGTEQTEEIDSCWGYYGFENVIKEVKERLGIKECD